MVDILADAKAGGYAVGSFNSLDLTMVRGVIRAAEDESSPVIISHAEVHFDYTPLDSLIPIFLEEASKARVPVALLLDHGRSFDPIVRALSSGMNSVMFDGSELGYEDNISQTKEIVKIAHAMNATVEGELGRVGRPENASAGGFDDDSIVDDESLYTDPDQAAEFVARTGVDALACAFGTAHGIYRKEPKLDFPRLKAISEKVGVPIVMHGGSGLSAQDFRLAIANGVTKVNYFTNMSFSAGKLIKKMTAQTDEPFYHDVIVWAQQAIYDDVRQVIRLFKGA